MTSRSSKTNRDFLFPLISFIIPLTIRAIPEVIMAPYITGFDTMAHYVPTTLSWINGGVDFWSFIATAPLFYSIIVLLVSSGGALIAVLKIIPPILHGFLGLSIFGYAKLGLNWSPTKSVLTGLLATVYFVSLRISWDMLRNELALILFFFVLILLKPKSSANSWKHYLLLSLGMSLVVLTHQLVSALMFGIIGLTMAYQLFKGQRLDMCRLFVAALPAVLIFFAAFYFSPRIPEYRLIFGFSQNDGWLSLFGFSSYWAMLASYAGFFLFLFLPILPFVIIGLKDLGDFQLRAWILLCLVLALIPLVSPSNLRWLMLLSYPFAFLVADALSRIKKASRKRFGINVSKVATVYLIIMLSVLSLGLLLMPPESPTPYFSANVYNNYVYQIPTSMLQNTVSIADCQDTATALQWVKGRLNDTEYLLTHRAFYGWALSVLKDERVILYEYEDPEGVARNVTQEHGQAYLIWWVNGQGWYGQPSVSSSFLEVYQSGRIAIYAYTPSSETQG